MAPLRIVLDNNIFDELASDPDTLTMVNELQTAGMIKLMIPHAIGEQLACKGGGTWIARRYVGQGTYQERKLGIADDFTDVADEHAADGDERAIKTFSQAQEEARSWWRGERRKDLGLGDGGPYTVRTACEDYLKHYEAQGGKSTYTVNLSIKIHILPALGDLEVAKLTTRKLRDWHHGLAAAPRRLQDFQVRQSAEDKGTYSG